MIRRWWCRRYGHRSLTNRRDLAGTTVYRGTCSRCRCRFIGVEEAVVAEWTDEMERGYEEAMKALPLIRELRAMRALRALGPIDGHHARLIH